MYYNTIIIYYDRNVVKKIDFSNTMQNLIRSGLPRKEIVFFSNLKSFIDQACSVNLAWYWTRSFFCVFINLGSISVSP